MSSRCHRGAIRCKDQVGFVFVTTADREDTETGAGSFVGIVDAGIGQRDQPAVGPNPLIVSDGKPAAGQNISGEESEFQSFLNGLSENGPQ